MLDDTTIAHGDIRAPGRWRNLQTNPMAEVFFVDRFRRKGERFSGTAEVIDSEAARLKTLKPHWIETSVDLVNRITALVMIHIDTAITLSTPFYDDSSTEAEMIALYRDKYARIFLRP